MIGKNRSSPVVTERQQERHTQVFTDEWSGMHLLLRLQRSALGMATDALDTLNKTERLLLEKQHCYRRFQSRTNFSNEENVYASVLLGG